MLTSSLHPALGESAQREVAGRVWALEGRLSESKTGKPAAGDLSWCPKGGSLFAQFPNYPEYRSQHRNQVGDIK